MGIYGLSFKNFKRRKLRSALTMLGVVIGVVALVALTGLSSGMTSYFKEETGSMMGDVTIMNSSSSLMNPGNSYLSKQTVAKIKNMSQLYNIQEETQFSSTLNNAPVLVYGVSDWNMIKIASGTPGVVVDKSLVDKFGYKIGSNITIDDKKMTVTGITNMSGFGMGFVALDIGKALPMNDNKETMITASAKGDPDTVKKEVESQIKGVTASTQSDFSKQIDDMMNGLTMFVGAIAGIALLVGVISIVNIMIVNVTERTREIGVLKAIGFTNRQVLGSILTEAGLLGVMGAVFGLIIAAVLLQLGIVFFAPQIGMNGLSIIQMLPLWLIGGVLGGSAILSVLAGLYPAWRASRLNVVEALRYE